MARCRGYFPDFSHALIVAVLTWAVAARARHLRPAAMRAFRGWGSFSDLGFISDAGMAEGLQCFKSYASIYRFITETNMHMIGSMTFASHLKNLRESAGLTQEELADKSGVNRSFIGLLESDKRTPPLVCLTQLAKALELSRQESLAFMELGALRHLKPNIRPILSAALARIPVIDARKPVPPDAIKNECAIDSAARVYTAHEPSGCPFRL